jgi:hypothetical protein
MYTAIIIKAKQYDEIPPIFKYIIIYKKYINIFKG